MSSSMQTSKSAVSCLIESPSSKGHGPARWASRGRTTPSASIEGCATPMWIGHAFATMDARFIKTLVALFAELTDDHLQREGDMTRAGLGIWSGGEMLYLHGIEHLLRRSN